MLRTNTRTDASVETMNALRNAVAEIRRIKRITFECAPDRGAVELNDEQSVDALQLLTELASISLDVLIDAGLDTDGDIEDAAEFIAAQRDAI